jgi:hypothetical protein
VRHPCRQARERTVGLVHDDELDTAALKPPPDAHGLAEARMKSVGDACFSLLFAGSMSPFQARVAPLAGCLCEREEPGAIVDLPNPLRPRRLDS